MRPQKLSLSSFVGRWKIHRGIIDDLGGRSGHLEGTAEIKPDQNTKNQIIYQECGNLVIEGAPPLWGERRYLWRSPATGQGIDVVFEDGRPFHHIELDHEKPSDTHSCPPDHYEVSYDFENWPAWGTEWKVRGPRKAYRMTTQYSFLGQL